VLGLDPDIIKSETDQLSGALSWDAEVNESEDSVPVLVAKTATLHHLASAPPVTRVITEETRGFREHGPWRGERVASSSPVEVYFPFLAETPEMTTTPRWRRRSGARKAGAMSVTPQNEAEGESTNEPRTLSNSSGRELS
jgi:hypothetical protein